MVSYLCKIAGVSHSGYYNYFSNKARIIRKQRDDKDEVVKDIVLKAYNYKGRKKGARQIKMTLSDKFGIVYNLKRIKRIMRKYDINCPIRKANPYRRMMKATKECTVVPNLLNRNFKHTYHIVIVKWHIYQLLRMDLQMKYWHIMYPII